MTRFTIVDLNRIIERDATDTTYKYALLRATSNIVSNHSPIKIEEGKVWYPTGFLVEKWIEYYYPIIDSETFIPQKNAEKEYNRGSKKLAFRLLFKQLTDHYRSHGGLKAFWIDYKRGTIKPDVNKICLDLAKSIWYTITRYPMKHLGYSVTGEQYSYYNYTNRSRIPNSTGFGQDIFIRDFGLFSLDTAFYEVLRTFGYYVSGDYSILNKWIEFTVRADTMGTIEPQYMYQVLNTSPEEERDVHDSRMFFRNLLRFKGSLECTWSGRRIRSLDVLAIDHAIPFSVWRNNDLWNLLPAHSKVNLMKKNMIPSESRARAAFSNRFIKEVEVSLLDGYGSRFSLDAMFDCLVGKCRNLVEVRGLPMWDLGDL